MRLSIERTYYHRETMLMLLLLAAHSEEGKRRGCGIKGKYKTALKQSAASAGVLKPVQPGENTLVVRTTYNGRHRLREARDHGMLRRIVPAAFVWLMNRTYMRSYCSVEA